MALKFCTTQVLAPHPVVPTMKGNTMVINYPTRVNHALEVSIPLVFVQLKLQGFHVTMLPQMTAY